MILLIVSINLLPVLHYYSPFYFVLILNEKKIVIFSNDSNEAPDVVARHQFLQLYQYHDIDSYHVHKFSKLLFDHIGSSDNVEFIIHSHTIRYDFFTFILKLIYRDRVYWISTMHNDIDVAMKYYFSNGKIISYFWKKMLSFSNKLIFLNHYFLKKYGSINNWKCDVIPNSIFNHSIAKKK